MKITNISQAVGLCAGMIAFQAQGALLMTGQNPSSPYYADFTSSSLTVNYVASTKLLTISDSVAFDQVYRDSSASPGTGNTYNNGNLGTGFTGSYVLTATLAQYGNVWGVSSGSFSVKGNLLPGGANTDLLLSGTLKTGAGTFGYSDTASVLQSGTRLGTQFDFLFNVSGGNPTIVQDFFGVGSGAGAMIVQSGNYNPVSYYQADFTKNFSNLGSGTADTFVPEPAAYAWASAGMAGLGLICVRRKPASPNPPVF